MPQFSGLVRVYHSAVAVYYAPSDPSGSGGMHKEWIRATPRWRRGAPRYDCIFVQKDPTLSGFRGLYVARVRLFFSFQHLGIHHSCALVSWYLPVADSPDDDTGMWIVKPLKRRGRLVRSVIALDTVIRGAHLMGVAGHRFLSLRFSPLDTLNSDTFKTFYHFVLLSKSLLKADLGGPAVDVFVHGNFVYYIENGEIKDLGIAVIPPGKAIPEIPFTVLSGSQPSTLADHLSRIGAIPSTWFVQ
ncbi:hypothetical protein HGRIS_001255 [Hohenbuehelia grisea]|uniref:DUF295 domain-containing protein n=1 Tax=Hohenbuehelia grisea TaxID=104357 RepID=A0ABR3JQA8_9AGAR